MMKTKVNSYKMLDYYNIFTKIKKLQNSLIEPKNEEEILLSHNILELAKSYEELENYEEAMEFYELFLNMVINYENMSDIIKCIFSLANIYLKQNKLDKFISSINKLEKLYEERQCNKRDRILAIKYYLEAKYLLALQNSTYENINHCLEKSKDIYIKYTEEFPISKFSMYLQICHGELEYNKGDFYKSLKHYRQALELALQNRENKEIANCYRLVSEVHEKLGEFKEAVENFKRYYEITEYIHDQRKYSYSQYLISINGLDKKEKEVNRLKSETKFLGNKINKDKLTGLFNRRFFNELLNRDFESSFDKNISFTIMMIDVDSFKKYNDNYGHIQGDNALRAVGKALKNLNIQSKYISFRYGGEEFVVALYDANIVESKNIANEILNNIRNLNITHEFSDVSEILTLSIGIATGNTKTKDSIEKLIDIADKALYYSKNTGKNRYTHIADILGGGC